jgi:radical SAM protein with 4Fe4S-binding SPASM domain
LGKLAKAYLKDKRLKPINLLTRPLMTIAEDPRHVEQKKFCGTGTHMVTYDYDGKAYGCHLFTPIVLGENAKCIEDIDYRCDESNADPYCAECRLKGVCPTCPGFNYRYRGSLGARDHRWCRMILEQMQVACTFQIKKIAKNKRHTDEEIAFAKHALEAYQVLSQFSHEALAPYVF